MAVAAAACIAASVLVSPTPAQAASPVRIYRIWYDSPGSDTRSNGSLNAEHIVLKNYTTSARSITGWPVRDSYGWTYKFPRVRQHRPEHPPV